MSEEKKPRVLVSQVTGEDITRIRRKLTAILKDELDAMPGATGPLTITVALGITLRGVLGTGNPLQQMVSMKLIDTPDGEGPTLFGLAHATMIAEQAGLVSSDAVKSGTAAADAFVQPTPEGGAQA